MYWKTSATILSKPDRGYIKGRPNFVFFFIFGTEEAFFIFQPFIFGQKRSTIHVLVYFIFQYKYGRKNNRKQWVLLTQLTHEAWAWAGFNVSTNTVKLYGRRADTRRPVVQTTSVNMYNHSLHSTPTWLVSGSCPVDITIRWSKRRTHIRLAICPLQTVLLGSLPTSN